MQIDNLIREALSQPKDAINYSISQALTDIFPDRALLETTDGSFNLEQFAHAGHCKLELSHRLHNRLVTSWHGRSYGIGRSLESGCYKVLWNGETIDVLTVSWADGRCLTQFHWIVADHQELADRFFRTVCEWEEEIRSEVLVFENGHWQKNAALYRSIQAATFENLILAGELAEELRGDFDSFFKARDLYERYNIPWKRGVLFLGDPGNGKTHTTKALINWLKQPCLYVKSFKSPYGTDHGSIRDVFARARKTTPCLLVLEDLDSLINDKNRSFFLNEMDGFEANTGVVVIATTNHPERLDPAILDRPSRFDRKYTFELPAAEERSAYLSRWNSSSDSEMRLSNDGLFDVVTATDGFSFAYLKELTLSSMMRWIEKPAAGAMDLVMLGQTDMLREQMKTSQDAPLEILPPEDDEEDEE
ncbi:hypothetical protein CCAX7_49810 [Capsulimonas corticalis]|uniref:Uncharacterized protein n=1 Tax=Capsulimonas corticalis TaxID=2219043 RepID=A0A402CPU3_9BACT|nr:ATP-binding protein [Capsulimonas corticalis]BDI32930.1 hypothetical protein CCAX7_49810 [Capsulimonas corticalis]